MIAGVKALPVLQTISASCIAKIGGTTCFSVKPKATFAPLFTTYEQPDKTEAARKLIAKPWLIFWTLDIFLSSM